MSGIVNQSDSMEGHLSPSQNANSEVSTEINSESLVNQICEATMHIVNATTSWKEIDMQMHSMDVKLQAFLASTEADIIKYRERVPVVKDNLKFVQEQIGKILDKALAMETNGNAESTLQEKLIEMSGKYLDRLSEMMIKLL